MKITTFCLLILIFVCCKSKEKRGLALYKVEKNVEVNIRSSCKISAVSDLKTDSIFKEKISKASDAAITKLKIKGSHSLEKSVYRISKTEWIITERCGAKTADGKPFIGLQEIIVLENTLTKQLVEFRKDTIVINSQTLNQPNTLVPKKLSLDSYISSLTEKNYLEVKNFLKSKK